MRKSGDFLDIEFMLKSGHTVILKGVGIKVFDALRMMKGNFDNHFVWSSDAGIAVNDIAGWRVIDQYEES